MSLAKKPTSLTEAKKLITIGLSDGMHSLYARGYWWVHDIFLPSMELLATHAKMVAHAELLSDAWYYLGHLHSCNGAPQSAVEAYRLALMYIPNSWWALRELACMSFICGDRHGGELYLKDAVAHAPKSERYSLEIQRTYYTEVSLTRIESRLQLAAECLAEWKPQQSWSVVARMRATKSLQTKARIQGVLQNKRSVVYWEQLCSTKAEFELTYTDSFFLSDLDWESLRFWRAIRDARSSIIGISLPNIHAPKTYFGPPELFDFNSYHPQRSQERVLAIANYHIARISGNKSALRSIYREFPQWSIVQDTLAHMQRHRSGPTQRQLNSAFLGQ
jgi:hypothetical protein